MWSLGKDPDPRVVLVLRAMRGVQVGVADGVAPDERDAWVSTFRSAGELALARREFQDKLFHQPPRPRFRIRAYLAAVVFGVCAIGGVVIGQLASRGYRGRGRFDNAEIHALGFALAGILIGIALAAVVLLGKLLVSASRPVRDAAGQKLLEERFRRLDPARRVDAVVRVLSGDDPTRVAEAFGVAFESLDAWGAVYLDAAQSALKQRFGPAG